MIENRSSILPHSSPSDPDCGIKNISLPLSAEQHPPTRVAEDAGGRFAVQFAFGVPVLHQCPNYQGMI